MVFSIFYLSKIAFKSRVLTQIHFFLNGYKIQIYRQTLWASIAKLPFLPVRVSAPRFSWFSCFRNLSFHFGTFFLGAKNSNYFSRIFPLCQNFFLLILRSCISTARSDFVLKLWGVGGGHLCFGFWSWGGVFKPRRYSTLWVEILHFDWFLDLLVV